MKDVSIMGAAVMCLMATVAQAQVAPAEMIEMRKWVGAKFENVAQTEPSGSLTILEHFDVVWRNCRVDRPLRLGVSQYRRGLFTHAPSDVLVKLPGAGREFTAWVGVDTNSQTHGGRGSVVFTVALGEAEEVFTSPALCEGMAAMPVRVDLGGAAAFRLKVGDAGDGISCDQAVWCDARVELADGRVLWLGDLPIVEGQEGAEYTQEPPFSFACGDKTFAELLPGFTKTSATTRLDDARIQHEICYLDPETGLEVRCAAVEYLDFPTVEWTLYFKNTGAKDTPIISDIQALDTGFNRLEDEVYARFARPGEFILHHHTGSICTQHDYEPHESVLKPKETKQLASVGGRGSNGEFPYFNIEWPGEGVIAAVGWPGQWRAAFTRDEGTGLRVAAGQELTHFTLHPGEEVRSPLVVLQFWKGDRVDAQNTWRRWMIAHNAPRPGGQLRPAHLAGCSSHFFGEMVTADEASQFQFIDRYVEERIPIDYWWMDAGWYVNASGWPNTGTWEVDTKRFPRGLRAITDHARAKGIETILWFEPERVTPGTWLYEKHPEWLLGADGGTKLLDLGNPEAWTWLVNHIDQLLTDQGVDLYRQDFNMDPLNNWRNADAPDRQGITEIRHVTGYLAFWDELLRRRPGLRIDTCASGGRRNDLETLRRSVPLWRSDYIMEPIGTQGCTYGISSWIPFHGTGVKEPDAYLFRSMMTPYPNCLWDARRLDLDYDELRRLTSQWKLVAPNYAGDFYPLTAYSLDRDAWIGWQFDRPEAGEGMVQVFRREESIYRAVDLVLRGLERSARYTITDLDAPGAPCEMTGGDLMDKGLPVEIGARPGAALFTYKHIVQDAAGNSNPGVNAMTPIGLGEIEIAGEIGRRLDITVNNNLLALDTENVFLVPFRQRNQESGYIGLGKLIDATVHFAAYTRDEEVLALKNHLVAEAIKTQEPDGYIGILVPGNRLWGVYDIHEMSYLVLGLTNDYAYFGEQASLAAAKKLADFIITRWSAEPSRYPNTGKRANMYGVTTGLDGALLTLFEQTKDQRYLDFCTTSELYRLPEWNSTIKMDEPGKPYHMDDERHAYIFMALCVAQLQLNTLQADTKLLKQAQQALDFLTRQDGLLISGSCSLQEAWHDNQVGSGNVSESCATAYLTRMMDRMLRLTGDSRFGNVMERAVYNALFAAQAPDGRQLRYFCALEGNRTYFDRDTFCCPNNWRRIVAELPAMVYYRSNDGLAVNLYTPSTATVDLGGGRSVTIRQETDYPTSGLVKLVIDPSEAMEFPLLLRIPSWCPKATLVINGQTPVEASPGESLHEIRRVWKPADSVTLDMPMPWRLIRGRKSQEGRAALMRGPVVYCIGAANNAELLAKYPKPGDLILDAASLGTPAADKSVRPGGMKVLAKAWPPESEPSEAPPLEVVLTEFVDPSGVTTYFRLANLNGTVNDELTNGGS
ncbi:MAG: glycoside hydrolase family 127 protein [Sedimentisphaerales bacterium]|nr:glycoside hydrolase family 127 protein [Sedimentisphaerales bacterium]